jgi:hypothetical protein
MIDMSQTEQQLGSFSDNPTRYHKEFLPLSWAYALTWGDTYNIINDTLIEDEKERIWKAAEQHTDQLHEQHSNRLPPLTSALHQPVSPRHPKKNCKNLRRTHVCSNKSWLI